MSTPTPRTDEARREYNEIDSGDPNAGRGLVLDIRMEALETELTAALARIAELETLAGDRLIAFTKYKYESESLTRQLSESQAQLASLREANAVLQSQVDNADINLEQVRMTQKGLWRTKVESAESRIKELEAQLASAREDGARLDYLFEKPSRMPMSDGRGGWLVAEYIGHVIGRGDTPRSAIDSARGVTSPPAVAEMGEKDAWQPIETAPKDGTDFLMCFPLQGNLRIVGWYNKTYGGFVTTGKISAGVGWLWQPLPPPPQGKETRE